MKRLMYIGATLLIIIFLSGCEAFMTKYKISVTNPGSFDRHIETVSIHKKNLGEMEIALFDNLQIYDSETDTPLLTQHIDLDDDGISDAILFQTQLKAGETKDYLLKPKTDTLEEKVPEKLAYSRFVPERTDDYAWENDRVAFRTYGPEAQRMVEENIPGGTLSSGIDCWLKRVDYPVIEKWYAKHTQGTGSYHEDTGEGLDNFHVGLSRGCGGIGIWNEEQNKLAVSKNFTSWRTLAGGYIRTMFELNYKPWEYNNGEVQETKKISLDLGSNLCEYEVMLNQVDEITVGLTLHENDGEITLNKEEGWFSYWQPHGDSELGMGIVVDPAIVTGVTEYIVDEPDMSHLFVHLKVSNDTVNYYAGFGWKKCEQFDSREQWEQYLSDFSKQLRTPLSVKIKRN